MLKESAILLVDDDEIEQTLIGERLEARGFGVVRASNGEEALSMMSERPFPVLLTDWQMPVMDGIEFARQVRARGMDDTYIIMLTVRSEQSAIEMGYEAGIDDYINKQVTEVELLGRITAAFNTSNLRRS